MLPRPHNAKSPSLDKNKHICKKNSQNHLIIIHLFNKNEYPEYKRRDNKFKNYHYKTKNMNQKIPVNNSMIVSYNMFLLQK